MSRPKFHAPGRGEFTLCGFAFDAFDSGDAEEPVVFAIAPSPDARRAPNNTVTCEDCRREITHIRETFNGFQMRAKA